MNDRLSSLLQENAGNEPAEDEYPGPDGLLYCAKCHTPTQCRVTVAGRERVVRCLCRCGQSALEERRRQDEEEERMNRIRALKSTGIQEKALHRWTFAKAEDSPVIRMARKYVDMWEEVKEKNLGLLLWGDVGTGKSYAAACIANALLDQGIPVLMTNFSKILNQMGGMYSEERYQYISSLAAYDLLIIDDLGIERDTEYAQEQVYAVVDERYKTGKPLIVTTNLTIDQLLHPDTVSRARVYSRVLELCTPYRVGGGDRRRAISRDKQQLVRDLVCGGKAGEENNEEVT